MPFFGDKALRAIRVPEVQALYDHCLQTGRPPSDRSVEMVLATFGRILAYAEAREEIGRNPVEVWSFNNREIRRHAVSRTLLKPRATKGALSDRDRPVDQIAQAPSGPRRKVENRRSSVNDTVK